MFCEGYHSVSSKFSTLQGEVSHVSTTSTVSGSVKKGKGNVSTSHKTDMRINGQAAVFNGSINLADGDKATLVGKAKNGEFRARALRNDETGVIYSGMTTLLYFLGAILILLGIPASFILVGIPMIVIGVWVIYEGYLNQSAINSLGAIDKAVS